MIRRFLAAVQFLTVLPVPRSTATPGQAAVFFPFIGVLLGALSGAVFMASEAHLTPSVSALLALAFLLIATGCLHEDGLADVADAIRAGRTQEKMFAILKDSRIGTYGALVLITTVLVRWQAIAAIRINPVYGLAAALALSRSALVLLAAAAEPAGDGLGKSFAVSLSRPAVAGVVLQAILFASLGGPLRGLAMLGSNALIIFIARQWFTTRLGGVNGDCLGATSQAVETVNLVILSWRHSS